MRAAPRSLRDPITHVHATEWTFTQESGFWPSIEVEGDVLERRCRESSGNDAGVIQREKEVGLFESFLQKLDGLKQGKIDPETLPDATNGNVPVVDYKDAHVGPYHAYLRLDRESKKGQWTIFEKAA